MPPGLAHALLGAALSLVVGLPSVMLGGGAWTGAVAAVAFYAGRERRQSEEHFGSNRIPPWRWKPRAWRDMGWPALAAGIVAALMEIVA